MQLLVTNQTTLFGPQNGFRLGLILEGITPEPACEQLKGGVEQDAAEYIVVKPWMVFLCMAELIS